MHRRIGARLEQAFAGRTSAIAPQLALRFEEARDVEAAIRHRADAARTANRRGAADEASAHLGHPVLPG